MMGTKRIISIVLYSYGLALWPGALLAQQVICDEKVSPQLRVDTGHPWRPPFGVDRVGGPLVAHVKLTVENPPRRDYYLIGYHVGREVERHPLTLARERSAYSQKVVDGTAFFDTAQLTSVLDEIALVARCPGDGRIEELQRQPVKRPEIDADARAQSDRRVNPVDLGAILVPHDRLLLAGGQQAVIDVAAISWVRDIPGARLRAWFDEGSSVEAALPLTAHRRVTQVVRLSAGLRTDRTILHLSITDGGRELWKKEIRTMIVAQPPHWPVFGAVETKLRYDAPVPMHDPKTGLPLPAIDYNTAWDSKLKDVVVFLPNGSRFVFWRGSSYVPFWASDHNTGACYQWAESFANPVKHADGTVDLPEPLFDRELRYGRVQIVESTRSRVHVRWTYQLTDNEYNLWGDHASEDYYFYPDGFGTRVLSVIGKPGTRYQLTEFIVLTPQAAFPLEVLPSRMADVLFLDGEKSSITFPFQRNKDLSLQQPSALVSNVRQSSMVYRFFAHQNDIAAAIYFSPRDPTIPAAYDPLYDQGQMVAPAYWGSHWPLSRGKWTGWDINEGIYSSPAHNSVAGWMAMPKPLSSSEFPMPDALGRSQNLALRRWSALIAMTDASDQTLLDWAQSYADPPSVEVKGARIGFPAYSPERRAIRLVAESSSIEITLKPATRTVNPVFELDRAPKELAAVVVDRKALPADSYAWDGATLWMKSTIDASGAAINLRFRKGGK